MNPENMTIKDLLRQHFPNIAERELIEEISTVGKVMHFEGGQTIMDYGSYIRLVPLVIKGTIKVLREDETGNEIFLYYLSAGQTCSMSFTCCMMHKKSIIRTIAEEDTELIGIPVKYVDQWMSRYQSWKNFIMTAYDARLYEMVRTIDSIAFQKMDERLLSYLEKKSNALKSPVIISTHQEIATDLNASREAISRLLKQLEKEGKLHLGRNKIELI